jgi:hypothetical protein
MGNWIVWAAPVSSATWNQSLIYRATSQAGTYSLLATQALSPANPVTTYFDESGGSNHWYKVKFNDSSTGVASSLSEALQGQSITLSYSSPSKVASRLQIRNSQNLAVFDGTTKPSIWEVIEMLQEAEKEIDRTTGHAWRETYAYDTNDANDYETHDLAYDYKYLTGIPIHLTHRCIRQFDSTKGDVLNVWNGSEYEDWLTTRTEGRANDWWVDYRAGTIWLRTYIYRKRPRGIQVRYRFGESTVPLDVEKAATYLVCAEVCRLDDRSNVLPEGGDNIPLRDKAKTWEDKADALLNRLKEFQMGVM